MKPIKFDEMNGTAAEDQPEYTPLPMYRNNQQIISCWQLTPEELEKIAETGVIWMMLIQPGDALITPSLLRVDSPFVHEDKAPVLRFVKESDFQSTPSKDEEDEDHG
ncbi:MAG: hypothetical protein CMB80_31155 [Flammeovirgaceae bacterium]|nr:hypothetical protein [Flammeovirgaceae bacterium]|tara:strand:- start:618 stop:938 length:321 start_codon:yes stop_codon:yes gene_type:complete